MHTNPKSMKPVIYSTALALLVAWGIAAPAAAAETQPAVQDSQAEVRTPPDGDVPLTEVEVQDEKEQNPPQEGSAASGYRYRTGQAGPLGKMVLKDTPFSLHVTSGELIENRGAHTESEALKTNPTVATLMESNTYSSLSRVMVRGFTAADQSDLRDGLVDRSFTYVPLENVERIEVLNGLSGFLYGFSAVGGSVNYISKQPVSQPLTSLATGLYGGGIQYIHADLGGSVAGNSRITYRLNAYRENGGTYIENSSQDRSLIAVAVNYQLSPATLLKADYFHQDVTMRGLAAYIPLVNGQVPSADSFDAARQYGQSWTHNDSEKTLMGIGLESKLNDNFKLRAAYRYGDMWRRYDYIQPSGLTAAGSYQERYVYTPTQYEDTHSAYLLFDTAFTTAKIRHDITFGYWGTSFRYKRGADQFYTLGPSNIYGPSAYSRPAAGADVFQNPSATEYESFMVGDRITINPAWSALLGVNRARLTYKTWDINTGNPVSGAGYTNYKTTPSVALVYKPHPNVATYVSYMQGLESGGYVNNAGAVNNGALLPPYVSDQWEAGVKATMGNMDVTAALFRMNKANGYLDPADSIYKQEGKEIHQGLEVTATGKVNERLTLIGGFTLMKAKIIENKSNPVQNGKVPVNVPEQMAKAYLEYKMPKVSGVTVSAGVNYFGRRPVDTNATQAYMPGATTFDAGIRYVTAGKGHKTTYNLYVSNIFNKSYWSYYRSGDGLLLGAPRMVSLSAKVEF
ncbi:MAG TPA: TonB-dependent siderophore receptor [Methylomusa anaerophila]|uniref:Ferrichrome receptor FcuA n=2 Tax=Methylomusa anaerophila TaxID=1930071 RepID=A0A348AFE9_9FIRM|nr:TonB-dependent siderophore receptor [Methylomusa anaerophila]BBB89797.1 ferrichrome receptor FcuA precursor [Methylomusa anaerophila]HML89156.1 TonB-dependent siderophore receptor [Methylomusa anaerophila]